jgi:hypothetical protein
VVQEEEEEQVHRHGLSGSGDDLDCGLVRALDDDTRGQVAPGLVAGAAKAALNDEVDRIGAVGDD